MGIEWLFTACAIDVMPIVIEESNMVNVHPNFLEVEGKKAFVVLPYAEYLEIEEQLQQLDDLKALRKAKALEADAPTLSLAEMRERYRVESVDSPKP